MMEIDPSAIMTFPQLKRRIIWDVIPDHLATQVSSDMGLHPASPEVESMEKAEARGRIEAIAQLHGLIQMMGHASAEAVITAISSAGGDVDMEPEQLSLLMVQTSMGIVAELVSMGILHPPHTNMVGIS